MLIGWLDCSKDFESASISRIGTNLALQKMRSEELPGVHLMSLIRTVIAVLVVTAPISTANAIPILLEATSNVPSFLGDFTIVYDDTGDGLLQLSEVTSFSGLVSFGTLKDRLTNVPDVAGISTQSGTCVFPDDWCLLEQGTNKLFSYNVRDWSYTLTKVVAVHEPATLSLLALGFVGMGLVRRRRRF